MTDLDAARPAPEPIAIIGIGCHFPGGATSPERFWELLRDGVDATRDVPSNRWDVAKFYDAGGTKSGKMHTTHGGFLDRLDEFDASFFGISPREAIWLDPQQRMLLRTLWEALEDAGQVPSALRGSDTGVFVGGFTLDYQLLLNYGVLSRYELTANSATGMMMTMLANRLSYVFDFRGPSMSVDTACSGSLVALHLAVRSIWNGECSMAVVGGSNAIISPEMTIAESKGGFLALDGRCKTFDASADGYARGEGAGVVVLKPLSQAQADGDPIYALVRGSAVSQDGHTTGITVPNGESQEKAMRAAYRVAGVDPSTVGYIEAHGTGTPLGDPIEAKAIGRITSEGRDPGGVCRIGSVKTNIGHLEAAAGVAGLTKAALTLHHGEIPPHLHLREVNPGISLDELRLAVPLERTPWARGDAPRFAGVNSFGFGGTNAHVVLEEAPPAPAPKPRSQDGTPRLLTLSARTGEALDEMARAYRDRLTPNGTVPDLRDIGWSAARHREHHDQRMTVVAESAEQAVAALDAHLAGEKTTGIAQGRVPAAGRPQVAFVCSGMGPQWWAMGRELLETDAVFRAEVERTDAELAKYTGWSLVEWMTATEDESRMAETELAQPANFAVQVGLAAMWKAWGIEPDAVVGHSTGEIAAQYLAGVLSFEDAVKVAYYRSSLQQRTTGTGRMLAVGMTPDMVDQAVSDAGPTVSVAAVNGPSAVTLAGESAVLESMAEQLEQFGVFHRFLTVKVPYHSHFMDPLREDLLAGLSDLDPHPSDVPLYSTVTGTRIDGSGVDANYWWQNVRGTVLFASAFDQMVSDGYTVFVEIGPHPVLSGSMAELIGLQEQQGLVVPSLRRKEPELATMLSSLGALHTIGQPVNWDALYPDGGNTVSLPAYPWQLESYWTESYEAHQDRFYDPVHPLLGQPMDAPQPTWEIDLNLDRTPWLADHRVQDNVVLPGAAFVEMALAAGAEFYGEDTVVLEDVTFDSALVLTEAADPRVRTVLRPDLGVVEISSYRPTNSAGARWTLHASARLRPRQAHGGSTDVDAIRRACTTHMGRDEFQARTEQMGFQYGPAFRAVESIDIGPERAVARVRAPEAVADDVATYHLHPSLLDASFQVLLTAADPVLGEGDGSTSYLPVGLDRVRLVRRPAGPLQVVAEVVSADDRQILSNLRILDDAGEVVAEVEGFRAQSLQASTGQSPDRVARMLHELQWLPQERERQETAEAEPAGAPETNGAATNGEAPAAVEAEEPAGPGTWLVIADGDGVADGLARRLTADGGTTIIVRHGDVAEPSGSADAGWTIDLENSEHFRRLVAELPQDGTLTRIVHLSALDGAFGDGATGTVDVLEADQRRHTHSVVRLMQAVAGVEWATWPRLWLVTRRAQHVDGQTGPVTPSQAPLWGLGRVLGHQEFTTAWGGLVDLDTGPADGQADLLYDEIVSGDREDQVAFRDGGRFVPRLEPARDLPPALPPSVRRDGCYLVTGGLGALGLLVAQFLVDSGATRLVLTSRSSLPDRTEWDSLAEDHPKRDVVNRLRELERCGASVEIAAVDVADEQQMTDWLAGYRAQARVPIRGVVHVAGVVHDELMIRMSDEDFHRVLRPKVRGGWLLHHLLSDEPLDFFVLYSSTGSTITSPGQVNYAAGNAYLDALAQYRVAQGLPAVSVGWGPWSVGMVEELNLEQFYASRGIDLITPGAGAHILARALGRMPAHVVAISADWAAARASAPRNALPAMYDRLGVDSDGDGAGADPEAGALLSMLAEVSPPERAPIVADHLRTVVSRVLAMDPEKLSHDDPLTTLGLDSMMAVEVKQRIEGATGVDVSVLELLQGSTVGELATRIAGSITLDGSGGADVADGAGDPAAGAADEATMEELDRLLADLNDSDIEALLGELEGDNTSGGEGAR